MPVIKKTKSFLSASFKAENTPRKIPLPRFVYGSILISLLSILFVILIQNKLAPQVPLFYGLPEGQEQLISSIGLMLPASCALAITLVNIIITTLLKNKFLQQTLILTSFAISLFSLITTVKIALLVGSF